MFSIFYSITSNTCTCTHTHTNKIFRFEADQVDSSIGCDRFICTSAGVKPKEVVVVDEAAVVVEFDKTLVATGVLGSRLATKSERR